MISRARIKLLGIDALMVAGGFFICCIPFLVGLKLQDLTGWPTGNAWVLLLIPGYLIVGGPLYGLETFLAERRIPLEKRVNGEVMADTTKPPPLSRRGRYIRNALALAGLVLVVLAIGSFVHPEWLPWNHQATPTTVAPAVTTIVSVVGAAPGGTARLTAHAKPGETCDVVYITPAGTISKAAGLVPKVVNSDGSVSWSWVIGVGTRPGQGTIGVICPSGKPTAPITIQ